MDKNLNSTESSAADSNLARRYLLGQLSEEEAESTNERIMCDSKFGDLVLEIEEQLYQEKLDNRLPTADIEPFEQFFLASAQRRQHLQIITALAKRSHLSYKLTNWIKKKSGLLSAYFSALTPVGQWSLAGWVLLAFIIGGTVGYRLYKQYAAREAIERTIEYSLEALNGAYKSGRSLKPRVSRLEYSVYVGDQNSNQTMGTDEKQSSRFSELSSESRNLQKAEEEIRSAIEVIDDNQGSQLLKARLLHSLGRLRLTKGEIETQNGEIQRLGARDLLLQALDIKGLSNEQQAEIESDLGAAFFHNDADMIESRKHLDKAVVLNPLLPQARFNLGLWHRKNQNTGEEIKAWREYLKLDSTSGWSNEARQYLQEAEKRDSNPRKDGALLREFRQARESQNDVAAWKLTRTAGEWVTGDVVWWQLTENLLSGTDPPEKIVDELSYLSNLSKSNNALGDEFIDDLRKFYQNARPLQLVLTREAHIQMNLAREAMILIPAECRRSGSNSLPLTSAECQKSDGKPLPTTADYYNNAQKIYQQAGNQVEAMLAGFWYYHETNNYAALKRLANEFNRLEYRWLLSLTYGKLASIEINSESYERANNSVSKAIEVSEKIDDHYGIVRNHTQRAHQMIAIGDLNEAEREIILSLKEAGSDYTSPRLNWRILTTRAELLEKLGNSNISSTQYYKLAAELLEEAIRVNEGTGECYDLDQSYYSHMSLGTTYAKLADNSSDKNESVSDNICNPLCHLEKGYNIQTGRCPRKNDMLARAALELGNYHLSRKQYSKAEKYYNDVVNNSNTSDLAYFDYSAHKGLYFCSVQENPSNSINDLNKLIKTLETKRLEFEKDRLDLDDTATAGSYFALEHNIFESAIDNILKSGPENAAEDAFRYAECSRARQFFQAINTKRVLSCVTEQMIPEEMLAQVREMIPSDVTVIEYSVLPDKLITWVINRERFEMIRRELQPADKFNQLVSEFRNRISKQEAVPDNNNAIDQVARKLYTLLLSPLEDKGYIRNGQAIFIIPDGTLSGLSFAALKSPEQGGQYAIEKYAIGISPSANIFVELTRRAKERNSRPGNFLLVSDPAFNDRHPNLERTPAEWKETLKLYEKRVNLSEAAATYDKVFSQIDEFDIVQFFGHQVVNNENPDFSALVLADKDLRARDLKDSRKNGSFRMSRNKLVILAACNSGVEKSYQGEGMIGMSRGFLEAGAPLVIGSLWKVPVNETHQLMSTFHNNLSSNGQSTIRCQRYS